MATKTKPTELETLIFSGAGALGVAYAGCINALAELGALKNIKTLGGSSAGSIISYAVALGYTPKEIMKIVRDADFGSFIDCHPPGLVLEKKKMVKVNLQSILTQKDFAKTHKSQSTYVGTTLIAYKSMSTNTKVKKFIDDLGLDKFGKKPLTFKQLYEKTGKKTTLVLTGCDVSTHQERYNSWITVPDMLVQDAVLASMSIPMVFPPVMLQYPSKSNPKTMMDCMVVDGGTLNNLPVNIGQGTNSLYIVIGEPINKLGEFYSIESFSDFGKNLMGTILNNPYQYIFSVPSIVEKTVQVPIIGVPNPEVKPGALTFDMTPEQMDALIASGYDSVMKHFK